jgi:WD40 repeat protein
MNYDEGKLIHLDIKSEIGEVHLIGKIESGTYANISVLNDSLVLLSGKFVYNYITGKKVSEFSQETFTTPSGKRIFQMGYDRVYEIDYTGKETGVSFAVSEKRNIGNRLRNLTKINENTTTVVVACEKSGDQTVVVYDLKSGKAVNDFDGFKSLNEKKEIHFVDISPDGSQLIIGNTKWVNLYNVGKGKKVGEFEEMESNSRQHFMQASFRADGKAAYVSSWYKLYILNTKDLTAEENIVINLKDVHVYQWKDRSGAITKERTYVNTKFFWTNYAVMKDGKYWVALTDEVGGSSAILYYMYLGDGGPGNKHIQIF